ncbi:MAG: histidine kinase [Bacteroidales bacterium]|nr:histidine kinase [Bacteroidales bacterium]
MKIKEYILNHISHKAIVYAGFWVILLLLPFIGNYFTMSQRSLAQLNWHVIVSQWSSLIPFLIIFLVNCIWLVPRLFMRQHYVIYIASVVLLSLSTFFVTQLTTEQTPMPRHEISMNEDFDGHHFSGHDNKFNSLHVGSHDIHAPHQAPPRKPGMHLRDMFFGPLVGDMFLVFLLVSFNIAVELFFKSQKDKLAIRELKYNEVQAQLDYLKYQINPHFFMNTLNNIHALVDIDTDKAKQTVIELSRLMRYLLYESNKKFIQLDKEISFLRHYIEIMRIRYPDDVVAIKCNLPNAAESVLIPPLLFISFVENAFKHGVSYRSNSYVNIDITIDNNKITFRCLNSNASKQKDQHHGIGLDNIRQRLELLYPLRYELSINESSGQFSVILSIPVVKATDSI